MKPVIEKGETLMAVVPELMLVEVAKALGLEVAKEIVELT